MKPILAPANRNLLRQYAWSNVLLAFDFDGTLAPIVADRDEARMRESTRGLLKLVAGLYPSIVVSGRARADVMRRLDGIRLRQVIGNHGLEPMKASGDFARTVRRWLTMLSARLRGHAGIELEDKRLSLAIHYRRSRRKKQALAAIREVSAELAGARAIEGKLVVNLLPPNAPHKGLAVQRARDSLGCDTAIYVGDDDTDEDVFSLKEPGQLLGIRVGTSSASSAPYFIRGQAQIDTLLLELTRLRAQSGCVEGAAP
ncbi:MAG: trehalose-phosphatase [Candidatus Wallbacteria bacterium]|nr:trehalose-phosphatase [Candidatus Wallbacteria bacterium]